MSVLNVALVQEALDDRKVIIVQNAEERSRLIYLLIALRKRWINGREVDEFDAENDRIRYVLRYGGAVVCGNDSAPGIEIVSHLYGAVYMSDMMAASDGKPAFMF